MDFCIRCGVCVCVCVSVNECVCFSVHLYAYAKYVFMYLKQCVCVCVCESVCVCVCVCVSVMLAFKGIFIPGKSFSLLSLVRTRIQCLLFGLVRLLFTLQFSQRKQTNPHVYKDCQSLDKKVWGRGKVLNKKRGGKALVSSSKQSWISSVI